MGVHSMRITGVLLLSILVVLFAINAHCKTENDRKLERFYRFVGKPLTEFMELARERGAGIVRVVEIDGKPTNLTKDLRADRLNIKTKSEGNAQIVVSVEGFF